MVVTGCLSNLRGEKFIVFGIKRNLLIIATKSINRVLGDCNTIYDRLFFIAQSRDVLFDCGTILTVLVAFLLFIRRDGCQLIIGFRLGKFTYPLRIKLHYTIGVFQAIRILFQIIRQRNRFASGLSRQSRVQRFIGRADLINLSFERVHIARGHCIRPRKSHRREGILFLGIGRNS